MADRTQSPAYEALRASSRRLLLFIEGEIARQGGGRVTIYADQFAVVGSIKVVLPGLSELHALGLIDVKRHTKRRRLRAVGSLARYRDGNARDATSTQMPACGAVAGDDADATGFGQRVIGGN